MVDLLGHKVTNVPRKQQRDSRDIYCAVEGEEVDFGNPKNLFSNSTVAAKVADKANMYKIPSGRPIPCVRQKWLCKGRAEVCHTRALLNCSLCSLVNCTILITGRS